MKKYILSKGVLVAIEGIDGAGKTTMVSRLKEHFTRLNYNVSTFKEPTNGKYGQKIKKLSENGREDTAPIAEMELFLLDRKEDCEQNIQPALDKNKLVFMDRYYFSSIAYQGSRGLDLKTIKKENEKIAIIPDIAIILDCAVTLGLTRIKFMRGDIPNHFEKEEQLEQARKIFRKMEAPYIQLIDASLPENQVFEHVKHIVEAVLIPYTRVESDQPDLFSFDIDNPRIPYFKN